MKSIQYTLVTDGPSDRLLKYPIEWLLQSLTTAEFSGDWADPAVYCPTHRGLPERLGKALALYPCDLLFVHRDAEARPPRERKEEIKEALHNVSDTPPAVCIIPVRMTEAWLLIDERAIREAASNPRGRIALELPSVQSLESVSDPKRMLFNLVKSASGLRGRRLKKLRLPQARYRIAELIEDFGPLKRLPAFRAFQDDLSEALLSAGLDS